MSTTESETTMLVRLTDGALAPSRAKYDLADLARRYANHRLDSGEPLVEVFLVLREDLVGAFADRKLCWHAITVAEEDAPAAACRTRFARLIDEGYGGKPLMGAAHIFQDEATERLVVIAAIQTFAPLTMAASCEGGRLGRWSHEWGRELGGTIGELIQQVLR